MLLGVDIGGSKVVVALGDAAGRVLAQERLGPPGPDWVAALDGIVRVARALCAGAGDEALQAIGISAPGPLDRARGRLESPPNLPGWRDVPVVDHLARSLAAPAFLENDANAAALAEWRFGAGQGASRLVYLTMSTGIGAGLVLDGRLYHGRGDAAGELGHAPVVWEGADCACGQRGCLEAYIGGRAWSERLRRVTPEGSLVLREAGTRAALAPEHVIAAARAGDAFARRELARFTRYLARGVVTAVYAYAPDVVVLGTIAAAAGEALCLAPLREQVAARVWPRAGAGLRIAPSALGRRGPALAGLCVAIEALAR